jgi:hypothetical protein
MGNSPFEHLPPLSSEHFKLYFYAAVLHIMEQASHSFDSFEKMLEEFPFLVEYNNELAGHGLEGLSRDASYGHWRDGLLEWEKGVPGHLPLRALGAEAGLCYDAITLLVGIGVVEEEPCFGQLFEAMHGGTGQRRPTVGLFAGWWRAALPDNEVRAILHRLLELGLVQVANPDAPRADWTLQIPGIFWDALRGEQPEAPSPWASRYPAGELVPLDQLILPDQLKKRVQAIPSLLGSGEVRVVVLRGPRNNGRRTVLGAVADALGRELLVLSGLSAPDDRRWALIGPLATLRHAMPAVLLEPAPGEAVEIPRLKGYSGPLGIVLGKQGGVCGPGAERALTVELEIPGSAQRKLHWSEALGSQPVSGLDLLCDCFRMTGGNIRRAAQLAGAYAALEGEPRIAPAHVQKANRSFNRQALDTLAVRVESSGDWSQLSAGPETLSELHSLEQRCRYRERLLLSLEHLPNAINAGVRALFTGPSGTGKTFAARLLASALQKDLYRLDLSMVVNKYIGETEKNLDRIFSHAEELDIILLVDEGDALLTQRTQVQSSNDRYANLETNYLLQRMESFEGILVVTTNAANRIDSAFQRRFDLVVDFRQPEAEERWAIWQLHLPGGHAVDHALLEAVAGYCTLNGGQIRNAVLHASLLALHEGGSLDSAHLRSAVLREYRKMGAVCPI